MPWAGMGWAKVGWNWVVGFQSGEHWLTYYMDKKVKITIKFSSIPCSTTEAFEIHFIAYLVLGSIYSKNDDMTIYYCLILFK
jgi:hypothetical protein